MGWLRESVYQEMSYNGDGYFTVPIVDNSVTSRESISIRKYIMD
jgi:hypothetical protein